MYKIIGADQKEYGPISSEQIRLWITEGRLNARTLVRPEVGTEWQPLSAFTEFAGALGVSTPPPFSSGTPPPPSAPIEEVLARDYNLDLGGCISNAWNLLTSNFGLILPAILIYFGIEVGIGLLGMIPFIGPLFSLANVVVVGALEGGLFYFLLKVIRRQPASAGDVFEGFRGCFGQLFLGKILPGLLASLCLIPAAIIAALVILIPMLVRHKEVAPVQIVIVVGVCLLFLIPTMVLQTNWIFTLPLIIDKKMNFWPAMQASWKMVTKHWWQVFALVILVGVINIVGMALCCVGLLFTIPVGLGALMYAYETIFSGPVQPPR